MQTIYLYGHLKKKFGEKHRFEVRTAGEALRALNCAFPGKFVEALREGSYKIVRGNRRTGMTMDIDLVNSFNLGIADLHIVPVAKGASNSKGTIKTILGVALIGGAIFLSGGSLAAPLSGMGQAIAGFSPLGLSVTWGNIAVIGLGLTLSGVASLLSNPTSDGKKDTSYALSGPTNTARQGDAIQLIYGECMVGSTAISYDVNIEDIGSYKSNQPSLENFIGGAFASWSREGTA